MLELLPAQVFSKDQAKLLLLLSLHKTKRLLTSMLSEALRLPPLLSKLLVFRIARLFSDIFKVRPSLHAGMVQKPLERYDPLAYRSRLPSPSVVMPYKNSSQIVLGDRR